MIIGINDLCLGSFANESLNINDENFANSYWMVTAWNVGAMVGPVIGLPLMENFGVRVSKIR